MPEADEEISRVLCRGTGALAQRAGNSCNVVQDLPAPWRFAQL